VCGILGEIRREGRVDDVAFVSMLETLAARGPDGAGWRHLDGGRVALGHRRLAIIDPTEASAQPIGNEDGSVWLSFNGEIYNYRGLRDELRRRGHHFRSAGDAEVIVHAYEEWGDACLRRLRGIFAFGLFDERRRRLLLARDRLGVKPLSYWAHAGGLVFASQPRAILAHPGFRPELDLGAFQHYLANRYVPFDLSIYAGMARLPAGHSLVWEDGRLSREAWWTPRYEPRVRDAAAACELIRFHIEDAVRSQLVSDVPIGLFLSGGIDSSTVGAVACEASQEPLASYTIGFDEAESDERRHARLASRHLGTWHHEERLSLADAVALLPTFVELFDEPFYDHSGLPTFAVSRLARRHGTKVVLSGDGADELFAGYLWYESPGRARGLRRRLATWLSGRRADPVRLHFQRTGHLDGEAQARLLKRAEPFDALAHRRRLFHPGLPPVTALQLLDLQSFLVDDVLTKVDFASMACGVEVRVPFLDHELVEAAFQIDSRLVFAQGERKALLKRAASSWLPPEILTGRKQGFGAPLGAWMRQGLAELAAALLLGGSLVGRGVLDADALGGFLGQARPKDVWLVLVAELWARRWLEGQDLAQAAEWARLPAPGAPHQAARSTPSSEASGSWSGA